MDDRLIIATTILTGVLAIALLFAPALGLPIGATPSTGDSMGNDWPVLNVYVDMEPEVGDVVVFETMDDPHTSKRTVHRAVERTDEGFVTQGDAEPITDQSVGVPHATDENMVGVVVFRTPITPVMALAGMMIGLGAIYGLNNRPGPK